MRVVVQRVTNAAVDVPATGYNAHIGKGLLVLAAFVDDDTEEDLNWIARKLAGLRIFDDEAGVMNLSINDVGGQMLIISQFTLYASTVKGNRPSYIKAAKPDIAIPLYEKFVSLMDACLSHKVECGVFGADMKVSLLNDGPVTIIIDSKLKF